VRILIDTKSMRALPYLGSIRVKYSRRSPGRETPGTTKPSQTLVWELGSRWFRFAVASVEGSDEKDDAAPHHLAHGEFRALLRPAKGRAPAVSRVQCPFRQMVGNETVLTELRVIRRWGFWPSTQSVDLAAIENDRRNHVLAALCFSA
jgi:hypothetical protein